MPRAGPRMAQIAEAPAARREASRRSGLERVFRDRTPGSIVKCAVSVSVPSGVTLLLVAMAEIACARNSSNLMAGRVV